MAALILGSIGAAVPGAAGIVLGIAGTLIGTYIDNEFIFKEDKDPQKPENLDLQSSAEGGPAIALIGRECRVRGQVIFLSPTYLLNGTETTVEVAIAVSNDGKPIDGIFRVYAEGFEIFNESGSLSLTTTGLTIRHVGAGVSASPLSTLSYIESPIGTGDLTKFRIGFYDKFTMSGWGKAENNWGNGTAAAFKGTVFLIINVPAFNNPSGIQKIGARRRLPDNIPKILFSSDEFNSPNLVTITQEIDPINPDFISDIEVQKGIAGQVSAVGGTINSYQGDAPEMEGTAWFGLRDFNLTKFGNRFPQVIAIVRQQADAVTLPVAIDKIFQRAGWVQGSSLSWNVLSLDQSIVKGYTMMEESSIHHRLQPLTFAFDLSSQIRDGEVYFFHPRDARVWEVDEFEWGSSVGEPDSGLHFEQKTEINLPTKITVHYVDEHNQWEDGAVERHMNAVILKSSDHLEIDLRSLTMDMETAVSIAERLLWRPHREGTPWNGKLPARYFFILENDIIRTVFNGTTIELAVTKADRDQNRSLQFTGHILEPDPPHTLGFF